MGKRASAKTPASSAKRQKTTSSELELASITMPSWWESVLTRFDEAATDHEGVDDYLQSVYSLRKRELFENMED
eukprot:317246-Amphidinium_carterae.1